MFTFGFSPIIDLDDARLFAQQFQPEEDRPTLRRIARASALCHHNLVWCLDASRFTVRSQRDLDVQYKVASAERNHLNRFIKAKKLNKRMGTTCKAEIHVNFTHSTMHLWYPPLLVLSTSLNSSGGRKSSWRSNRVKVDCMWRLCSCMIEGAQ